MHKFLPILLIVLALILAWNHIPIKREIVYKLGISGDPTTSCCNEETISQTGDFDEETNIAIFNGQIVDYPKTALASNIYSDVLSDARSNILGTTNPSGEEKWIEVHLGQQKLRAWEGNTIVMEFPISSGKWAPTPEGTFYIWYKTRNQRMQGGSKDLGTYYNLPNVPHNMFYYKGYAIHGAYWHNNFGNPMSHGCVNEPLDKAGPIFEWAGPVLPPGQNAVKASPDNPGTKVFVHKG